MSERHPCAAIVLLSGGLYGLTGQGFVPHRADDLGAGADETDFAAVTNLRQFRVFGQKTVAGVEGVATGGLGQVDQTVGIQIAGDRVRAQAIGLIGLFNMQGIAVGFSEYGHGLDAHFRTGTDNPHSDFASIGDQDFFYHRLAPERLFCLTVPRRCQPRNVVEALGISTFF